MYLQEKGDGYVIKGMLFNGLFVKKCWSIIKQDFYQLSSDFYDETIQLKNINGSYITLVPKKQCPIYVNEGQSL
jgi:hypothetical protein